MSKTATINIRIDETQRSLLNKAAEILGVDRSTFILSVSCEKAHEVLLDQRLFQLNESQFEAFEAALNAPVDSEKLSNLLRRKSPWEE